MFLSITWSSFLLSNVGIYLVYVTQIEPSSFGYLQIIIIVVALVSRISSLPGERGLARTCARALALIMHTIQRHAIISEWGPAFPFSF